MLPSGLQLKRQAVINFVLLSIVTICNNQQLFFEDAPSVHELIYITNEAVGRVGYYQLISSKSEKNNCFSKFSSNSLDFFG